MDVLQILCTTQLEGFVADAEHISKTTVRRAVRETSYKQSRTQSLYR